MKKSEEKFPLAAKLSIMLSFAFTLCATLCVTIYFNFQFQATNTRIGSINLDAINSQINSINARISSVDMDSVNSQINAIKVKMTAISTRIQSINEQMTSITTLMNSNSGEIALNGAEISKIQKSIRSGSLVRAFASPGTATVQTTADGHGHLLINQSTIQATSGPATSPQTSTSAP